MSVWSSARARASRRRLYVVSVYAGLDEDSASHGLYTHGGSRGLCDLCGAELLIVYIGDSESVLGIDCPLVGVQQGGSQAVKTDSGLLPEFAISVSLCDHARVGAPFFFDILCIVVTCYE